MKSRANSGFTLIELLVAISLFAVAAAALGTALSGGLSAWRRAEESTKWNQQARVVFSQLGRELRNAVSISTESFHGEESALSFYTVQDASVDAAVVPRVVKVSYGLESAPAGGVLKRSAAVLSPGQEPSSSNTQDMTFVPAGWKLQYAYASNDADKPVRWEATWKYPDAWPAGVRAVLSLRDPEKNENATFEKTLFIPRGELKPWKE